jgi:hypothetical protein
MELIITFFIIFALGIILALFFMSLYKIKLIFEFSFSSTSNLFFKFYNFVVFSFSNPIGDFVDGRSFSVFFKQN